MEPSFFKKLVVPAAVLPFLAPMAAFAAEGTGRVSYHRIHWLWLILYVHWNLSLTSSTLNWTTGFRHWWWQTHLRRIGAFRHYLPFVLAVVQSAGVWWLLRRLWEETPGLNWEINRALYVYSSQCRTRLFIAYILNSRPILIIILMLTNRNKFLACEIRSRCSFIPIAIQIVFLNWICFHKKLPNVSA